MAHSARCISRKYFNFRDVHPSPAAGLLRSPASARRFGAVELAVNDGGSAANPGVDGNRTESAILGAGATFHAAVQIDEMRLAVFDLKHGMGADLGAKAATRAFCLVQS